MIEINIKVYISDKEIDKHYICNKIQNTLIEDVEEVTAVYVDSVNIK